MAHPGQDHRRCRRNAGQRSDNEIRATGNDDVPQSIRAREDEVINILHNGEEDEKAECIHKDAEEVSSAHFGGFTERSNLAPPAGRSSRRFLR